MKNKIKAFSKQVAIILTIVVVVIAVTTGTYEGYIRPIAVEYFTTNTDTVHATSTPVSEYEVWLASEEVTTTLDVMYKKYLIDQKQVKLDAAQKALEAEKEALRAKQVGF